MAFDSCDEKRQEFTHMARMSPQDLVTVGGTGKPTGTHLGGFEKCDGMTKIRK